MLAAAAAVPAGARPLTLALPGGQERAAVQGVYVGPFANATGIATAVEAWDNGLDALRSRLKQPEAPADPPASAGQAAPGSVAPGSVAPGSVAPGSAAPGSAASGSAAPGSGAPQAAAPASGLVDVALVSSAELQAGCDEGLFEKLDWSAIGGKDHYQAGAVSDCGVGGLVRSLVLSWDRDKFPATPTWGDFFDVAKYPGKRGLRRDARGSLEFALLSDGVPPGDVYKALRGSEGVDRAFHKLEQLRPYVVWWQRPDEAAQLLASGEVLMTSAPNGAITLANHTQRRNLGVQWSGALTAVQSWAVVKGSTERAQAMQFLYFAGMPAIQARMLPLLPYPGLAKGVNELAPPEQQLASPTLPANLSAGLIADEGFWRENQDRLEQRFAAWLIN